MSWETFLILVIAVACTGIHLPPENPYEESDATAEVHPRQPRAERTIPEWSQFFYLRTPGRRDESRGFSYHVANRNLQPSGSYHFPINRKRPEFPVNNRRPLNVEPPKLLRRWNLRDPENDSGRSSESLEESPDTSLEKGSENNRREVEYERPSRVQSESQRSSRISNERERESEPQLDESEEQIPVSNRRSNRQDSHNPRWQSTFHDPTPNQRSSSRLTQDQDNKGNSHLPFPEDDEVPEIPNIPSVLPRQIQGTPHGVVDTYLQFPPIAFRFHISPKVHVLRPSDVMVHQPFGGGFRPVFPLGNSTASQHLGDGNRVRISVVAVGHGKKDEDQVLPPPHKDTKTEVNLTAEIEELTTRKSSTIIHNLLQQREHNRIEKLTESTTAVTPEVTSVKTTSPATTAHSEKTTTEVTTPTETTSLAESTTLTETTTLAERTTLTETTTHAETTTLPTTTTSQASTVEQTSSPSTLEKFLLEIKTTILPETTTNLEKEGKKESIHQTAKTPCDHSPSTQPPQPTTEVSTATSVVETRVDIKTTSAVSEHFVSHSNHKSSKDQANSKNEKDNIVFMAAENLELW